MATYKVITEIADKSIYEVEANSEEEARNKMYDYIINHVREDVRDVDFITGTDEEVISVEKLRD